MAFLCPTYKKRSRSGGTSIVNAYGVSDISEECGLPDQIGSLVVQEKPVQEEDKQEVEPLLQNPQHQQQPQQLEVIESFTKCSTSLQLPVEKGEIVTFLGSEGPWVFVRTINGADGYIPRRHCRVIRNRSEFATHAYNSNGNSYTSNINNINNNNNNNNNNQNINNNNNNTSDVGYYSDHHCTTTTNRFHHRATSTPIHDMTDGRHISDDDSTTASLRDLRREYDETTRHIRSVSDCIDTAAWNRHDTVKDVSLTPTTTNKTASVCGRSCSDRCIHKTKPDTVQSVGRVSDIQLVGSKCRPKTNEPRTKRRSKNSDETTNSKSDHRRHRDQNNNFESRGYQNYEDVLHNESHDSFDLTDDRFQYPVENESRKKDGGNDREMDPGYDREHRDRLERHLRVNEKVVNDVITTLDHHKQVHDKVTSYWRQTEANFGQSKWSLGADGIDGGQGSAGAAVVVKDYEKTGERDISVKCGDVVVVVGEGNKHPGWILVRHEVKGEGYIPLHCTLQHHSKAHESKLGVDENLPKKNKQPVRPASIDHMQKMIVHERVPLETSANYLKLSVGEYVLVESEEMEKKNSDIEVDLHVYSPRYKCYGCLPAKVLKEITEVEALTV